MSGRNSGDGNDNPPSFASRLSELLADQASKIVAGAIVAFTVAGFSLESRVTGVEQWSNGHDYAFTDFRSEVRQEFDYDRDRVDEIYRQLAQCNADIARLDGSRVSSMSGMVGKR